MFFSNRNFDSSHDLESEMISFPVPSLYSQVWNGLVISSLGSLYNISLSQHVAVTLALLFGLLQTSYTMYWCLVHYTGAIPAEHFSCSKRPYYHVYKLQTNMFFPGPSRKVPKEEAEKIMAEAEAKQVTL